MLFPGACLANFIENHFINKPVLLHSLKQIQPETSQYFPSSQCLARDNYIRWYSEYSGHVWSELDNSICLRNLFALYMTFCSEERPYFHHTCATCSELPSNISTMMKPMLQTQNTNRHGNGIRPRLAVGAGERRRRYQSCSEPAGAGGLCGQVLEEPEPVGQPTAGPQELDVGPKECHDLQNRIAKVSIIKNSLLTKYGIYG